MPSSNETASRYAAVFTPSTGNRCEERMVGQISFGLAELRPAEFHHLASFVRNSMQERPRGLGRQTTLPELFSSIYSPFFASFLPLFCITNPTRISLNIFIPKYFRIFQLGSFGKNILL
jgi:hypothetical protein